MEHRTYVETFLNFKDASLWLEKHLEEFGSLVGDWYIEQASINYMSGVYRTGFVVSKKQLESFDEES